MILRHMRRNAVSIQGERSSALELARGRLVVLGMFFVLAYSTIAVRAVDLGVVQGSMAGAMAGEEDYTALQAEETARRGNIYDRNGALLATTLKTASLYVDPSLILEPGKLAKRLTTIFPRCPP